MEKEEIHGLLDSYITWVHDNTLVFECGKGFEIVTPVLNRNNDCMNIYVVKDGDGYMLTDFGDTIADLEFSGCDVLNTPGRMKYLERVTKTRGVELFDGELRIRANKNDFPAKKHMLVQTMTAVDDLFYTVKESVPSLFLDDVAAWLTRNKIRYIDDSSFIGKSGLVHRYDFVMPKDVESGTPVTFMTTINNPTTQSVENSLFSWIDTVESRHEASRSFIVLNTTRKSDVRADLVEACHRYDMETYLWPKQQEELLRSLAA